MKPYGCPHINIYINDVKYEILLDSGIEISVISTDYKNQIINKDTKTLVLPLVGLNIYLVVGEKSTKVTKQILLPIKIKTNLIHAPFIIVQQLNEGGIMGSNFLETYKTVINYESKMVEFKINHEKITIPLESKTSKPIHIKTISTNVMKESMEIRQIKTLQPSKQ